MCVCVWGGGGGGLMRVRYLTGKDEVSLVNGCSNKGYYFIEADFNENYIVGVKDCVIKYRLLTHIHTAHFHILVLLYIPTFDP